MRVCRQAQDEQRFHPEEVRHRLARGDGVLDLAEHLGFVGVLLRNPLSDLDDEYRVNSFFHRLICLEFLQSHTLVKTGQVGRGWHASTVCRFGEALADVFVNLDLVVRGLLYQELPHDLTHICLLGVTLTVNRVELDEEVLAGIVLELIGCFNLEGSVQT